MDERCFAYALRAEHDNFGFEAVAHDDELKRVQREMWGTKERTRGVECESIGLC
jgi:hypothetical protein